MSLGIILTLLIGRNIPVPAPAALIESLESVDITNTDQGQDGFQITFSAGRGSGASDAQDYALITNPLLQPFNRVIIVVTMGMFPKVLIDGIITHQQLIPNQEPGKSVVIVTGEDLSVMMDIEEKVQTYPNVSDAAIINQIVLSYAQYGLVPDIRPPDSSEVSTMVDRIPVHRGTDLSYIKKLSKKHAYVFYLEPTDVPGMNNAYWGPPYMESSAPKLRSLFVNSGPNTNVSLISFEYKALQPQLVTGKVEDRADCTSVSLQTSDSTRLPLSKKPALSQNLPYIRKSLIDSSGMTGLEAKSNAQALTDISTEAIIATGELDSLVYGDILRAHNLVGVKGTGYSYDGTYYVNSVTHQITLGEYKQRFVLSREGLGALSSVMP